jgi:hypothetical protein
MPMETSYFRETRTHAIKGATASAVWGAAVTGNVAIIGSAPAANVRTVAASW